MKKFLSIYLTFFTFSIIYPNLLNNKFNCFIENKKQLIDQFNKTRNDIKFYYSTGCNSAYFHVKGVSYQLIKLSENKKNLNSYRVDFNFIGSNNNLAIMANNSNESFSNFYSSLNNCYVQAKSYNYITYKNIYKAIDLKYYFKDGQLKYDYIIQPNNDYKKIRIKIKGAKKIYLNKSGDLIISTPYGNISEKKPVAYQNGKSLSACWIISHDTLSFNVDNVDYKHTLTIDPLIRLWGTYNGGTGQDLIYYSKTDISNNLYVSGYTNSTSNIATIGTFQNTFGGQGTPVWGDAFIAKYNSSGVKIWSTYYGGNSSDFGSMINIDASGNVYLVGASLSTNTTAIATIGAHQSNYGGGTNTGDAFIVKFDSNGLRLWGTYYGGTGDDYADGATLDNLGNLYVTGVTSSTASNIIATFGSHQQTYGGGSNDAFLIKFDSNGNRLWGSYYGGSGSDNGLGCNFDSFGNILISGYTTSTNNISTSGAHQINFSGGSTFGDGFFAQFNASGNRLYGTYYGGAGEDYIGNVITNTVGDIFISGSSSTNTGLTITTLGSYQSVYGGGSYDLFLAKFNSSLIRQWGTYYGGGGNDEMGYCAVSNNGVFLSGRTTSASQFALTTPCSHQTIYGGGFSDACLAKFDFSGNRIWSTLYGRFGVEDSPGISCNQINHIYLTGGTNSSGGTSIATPASQQPTFGGGFSDGFIVKFDSCQQMPPANTTSPQNMQVCYNNTTVLSTSVSCGINWYNVAVGGTPISSGSTFLTNNIISNTTFYIEDTTTCGSTTRTAVQLTVVPQPTIVANISSNMICEGQNVTLTLTGANTYSLNNNQTASNTIVITPSLTTTYTIMGINSNSCANTSQITVSVSPCTYLHNNILNSISINCHQSGDYIEINSPLSTNNNFKMKMLSLSGQIIFENLINENPMKFSIKNLASSVYLILITDNYNNIIFSDKIIR